MSNLTFADFETFSAAYLKIVGYVSTNIDKLSAEEITAVKFINEFVLDWQSKVNVAGSVANSDWILVMNHLYGVILNFIAEKKL